jgi:hypothetical protein
MDTTHSGLFCPTSKVTGRHDLATYQLDLTPPNVPTQHTSRTPVALPRSLRSRTSNLRGDALGRRGHLMLEETRCNHLLPHAHGNRHSRAGICPVMTWQSSSTTKWTHINVMITLTQDRLTWWGQGYPQEIRSTKDPDGQHQSESPFLGALCHTW